MQHLHAVLLLPLKILGPQGVDGVNHDLDQLDLGVSKTVLVGNVISAASLATGLSTGSTGLDIELFTTSLELVNGLLGPSGKINVDRGTHTSSKIGWAGVDESVLFRQSEVLATLSLDRVSNSLDSTGKTREHSLDISSLLHGDDSHLILLIDPEEEGLGSIVEDATALGPVTLHTSNSQVAVSGDEEEVVIHKLLPDGLVHASEGVVGASEVASQVLQGGREGLLEVNSLLLGDSGRQTESINIATNTDTGGVDRDISANVTLDLLSVHVGGVLGISGDAVVLLDDSIEDLSKVLVGVPVSSVDAAVLVVELNGASAGLGDGEAAGLGLDVLDLVPSLLGHVLGDQGVGGLDDGELSRHSEY